MLFGERGVGGGVLELHLDVGRTTGRGNLHVRVERHADRDGLVHAIGVVGRPREGGDLHAPGDDRRDGVVGHALIGQRPGLVCGLVLDGIVGWDRIGNHDRIPRGRRIRQRQGNLFAADLDATDRDIRAIYSHLEGTRRRRRTHVQVFIVREDQHIAVDGRRTENRRSGVGRVVGHALVGQRPGLVLGLVLDGIVGRDRVGNHDRIPHHRRGRQRQGNLCAVDRDATDRNVRAINRHLEGAVPGRGPRVQVFIVRKDQHIAVDGRRTENRRSSVGRVVGHAMVG